MIGCGWLWMKFPFKRVFHTAVVFSALLYLFLTFIPQVIWHFSPIAKINSIFNFNLHLNWIEFSWVLSEHPPTHHPTAPLLVVELQLHQQLQLLASTTASSSTWPSSATAYFWYCSLGFHLYFNSFALITNCITKQDFLSSLVFTDWVCTANRNVKFLSIYTAWV